MTDAHERITLPPISSFDITPSTKHHSHLRAGPSRRGSHFRGSSSWDGSSGGSNHPHNEFDDISYRPRSGKYDALDSSRHGCHMATGQSRHNHSPYSEPTVLIAPYESISTAPRPRSSSAALDRGGLFAPHVSRHGRKSLASCISSREPSPDSQASFSPSVTASPNIRSHLQSITDAKTVGVSQRRTPPVRKRKASEMLGGSPGSEDRAVSPEPSESEAKKKYKKKMNVRHYRAQNKDAMTQLRDALPEHMRPPERQAKAYVTLSAIKYIHELTAENERLRAENIRQAKELGEPNQSDRQLSSSVEVAITGDETEGTVPKAEVPCDTGK
ncbi:hypothetical protein BGY98DRAFT_989240 [Russula aff. rugulosa BPL654]|nr:hypothetical protein BGY98DRAFT_989240 [Russula aff. rugulosa BPL654]